MLKEEENVELVEFIGFGTRQLGEYKDYFEMAWSGHVERKGDTAWVKRCRSIEDSQGRLSGMMSKAI